MRYYIIKHVETGMFYLSVGRGMTTDRSKAHHYGEHQLDGSIRRWLKEGNLRLIPVKREEK